MFRIILFDNKYHHDLLFCYLLAKDSLGGKITIRDDLFNIQKNYFDKNDMFWIAIDSDHRVVGMVGTKTVSQTDLWLKRLFIKPNMKRCGIGSALLDTVEKYAKTKGISIIHTRFNDNYIEASGFYSAKGFKEIEKSDGLRHFIKLISEL